MNSAFCVAVHALICLNRRQEQLSSEELARSICTNPARVRKIMAGLKRAGLVETKEGNEGGYRFVGDPAALTLDQVARALEVRFVSTNWRGGAWISPAWRHRVCRRSWTVCWRSWTRAAGAGFRRSAWLSWTADFI